MGKRRIPFFTLLISFLAVLQCVPAFAAVIYVNGAATGTGDGSSWTDAVTTIPAAITIAVAGDELWIAKGAYTGTSGPIITMKDGVSLYGGFLGTETARTQRNPAVHTTTIDGADTYRCVVGASNAALDGFIVQNGRQGTGAGMYNNGCTALTIANCTFSGNRANSGSDHARGGAIYSSSSTLTVTQCSFTGNVAETDSLYEANGGALYNDHSPLTLTDCSFSGNTAENLTDYSSGGAIYNYFSDSGIYNNCVFMNNKSTSGMTTAQGGAIRSLSSTYDVVNCIFVGNSAAGLSSSMGGAVSIIASSPRFINCTFTRNSVSGTGAAGAFYCDSGSYPTVTNCIFYGNSASDENDLYYEAGAGFNISYSCVSTGWAGTAIITSDPLFVDGTDGGNGYDLRLRYNSPAINAGTDTSALVPASATDLLGIARPQGVSYDLGAHEYIAPVAAFSAFPAAGAVPLAVTFTDESTAPSLWPITGWAWNFGDGGVSAEASPSHTYYNVGVYEVTLTVTTTNGTRTIAHIITAQPGVASVTTWPTASAITYGHPLSDAALNGGTATVSGDFTFGAPTIIPNAGTRNETVIFTPTDRLNYAPAYGAANVTVTPVTPSVSTWPTAGDLIYGQALSAASLSGGAASVDGAFAFTRPDLMPAAGAYTASVAFTPADAVNYTTVSGTAEVAVAKAAPVITTPPLAGTIIFGEPLSSSLLTGGQAMAGAEAIAGVFAFSDPTTLPDSPGVYTAPITFTPADTANYLSVVGSAEVLVNLADCPECTTTTGPYTVGGMACLTVPGNFSSSATFHWSRMDGAPLDAARVSGSYCRRLQISNLQVSDSETYECVYTDGSVSNVYSVTISVAEEAPVPAAPQGWRFILIVGLAGMFMTLYYRRLLRKQEG